MTSGDFDYGLVNTDIRGNTKKSGNSEIKRRPSAYMIAYDLKTGTREDIGILRPTDGSFASGMEAAGTDKDGKVWFVGLFEQTEEAIKVKGGFRSVMGLAYYDPFAKQ